MLFCVLRYQVRSLLAAGTFVGRHFHCAIGVQGILLCKGYVSIESTVSDAFVRCYCPNQSSRLRKMALVGPVIVTLVHLRFYLQSGE